MNNPGVSGRSIGSRDAVFDALADGTRREALRIVHERSPAGVAKTDLAYELAAVTADKSLAAVADDDHQRARLDCHHRILPALFDAGLLAETDDDRLVTTDHPLIDDALEDLLTGETDEFEADLDDLFTSLADSRRRTILTVLSAQYHPLSTETLARDVAAREASTTERGVSQERVDEVRTSLVHVHLPLLNDAGLIGYDAETDTVSYEGHPLLRVEWLETDSDAATDATTDSSADGDDCTDGDDDTDGVQTVAGRERIIATGQSLLERADDELFMMITTTGLLEEGCFRRIEDAVDRGVDVYVGSQDPRVRELVRDRVPAAVQWEPQLDWMDHPPDGNSVGRLVFADREAVLLGTLGSPVGGEYDETAIVGDGPENGLVVLMRQLVGSQLDDSDATDETLETEIPL